MRQLTISWAGMVVLALAMTGEEAKAQDQWRPPTQSGQGTRRHGLPDTLEAETIPLVQPGGHVFAFGLEGQLKTNAGLLAAGQTFQNDRGTVTFVVTKVVTHQSILHSPDGGTPAVIVSPPAQEYEVKVNGVNVCGLDGTALAVPDPPAHFTFACVPHGVDGVDGLRVGGGAIAKCMDWGYAPRPTTYEFRLMPKIDPTLATYDEAVAKRFHQTCIAMATADYCGEGASNTVDNTPIGFADIQSIANPDAGLAALDGGVVLIRSPPPEAFPASAFPSSPFDETNNRPVLEAVWGVEGCGDGGISTPNCGRAKALCVSKARWDTMSLAATCQSQDMARLIQNPCPDLSPKEKCRMFCDQWTLADLKARKATLISYSALWDRALVSFKSSDHWITTSMVVHHPDASGDDHNGFALANGGAYTEVQYEGKIFKGSIPTPVRERLTPLVSLYRCKQNGEYLLASGETGSAACSVFGYEPDGPEETAKEGWIYAPAHPEHGGHDALYLWKKADSGDRYATSKIQPTGYGMVKLLGYLVGPGHSGEAPPPSSLPPGVPPPLPRSCGGSSMPGGRATLPLVPVLGGLLLLANGGWSLRRRHRRKEGQRQRGGLSAREPGRSP